MKKYVAVIDNEIPLKYRNIIYDALEGFSGEGVTYLSVGDFLYMPTPMPSVARWMESNDIDIIVFRP